MPCAPLLWPSRDTPADEVEPIKDLNAALMGVEYSVEAWDAALHLYETAKHPPSSISKSVASRWRFIACNECILELYHLRSRLEKIRSVKLKACPSLGPFLDASAMRSGVKRLDDWFPDIESLRHATAHRGENEAHPEVHAPDGQYALSGFRQPDRFSTPYRGSLRHLDITTTSLENIREVVATFLGAFVAAASELARQGHVD